MGYDKIIVVLTKPMNYKKSKPPQIFAKTYYRKYPKLVEAINTRYIRYNESIDKINELEKRKEIFVLRPSRKVEMSRIEKDPNKLEEMYDLGISDTNKALNSLREYLKNSD